MDHWKEKKKISVISFQKYLIFHMCVSSEIAQFLLEYSFKLATATDQIKKY